MKINKKLGNKNVELKIEYMKKLSLLVVILLSFSRQAVFGQATYTVSNFTELETAINSAVVYAEVGSGQTATIILNAGGLITINSDLPEMNHTKGKIIIKKGDSDSDDEGLIAGTCDYGFRAWSNEIRSDIEIHGLIFDGFEQAISFKNFNNLKITNCDFMNCSVYALKIEYTNASVSYNAQVLDGQVIVSDNYFYDCETAIDIELDEFILSIEIAEEDYTGDEVFIENNVINDCKIGLFIRNHHSRVFAHYFIRDNQLVNSTNISGSTGVLFTNPRRDYVIMENTDVTRFEVGMQFSASGVSIEDGYLFGIDFIEEPNSASFSAGNTGNNILDCNTSYSLDGEFFEYNLVGLEIEGKIKVRKGFPSTIRDCEIMKSPSWSYDSELGYSYYFIPIDHRDFVLVSSYPKLPNNGIDPPILINAEILLTDININYLVTGLEEENLNYVIEFFEIDEDKSIIQFIGSQNITSALDFYGLVEFNDISITEGNKIGATLTSIGNVLEGEKIGTSELTAPMSIQDQITCEDCEKFSPTPGERYWMSAWVNVDETDPVKTYSDVSIQLMAFGEETAVVTGTPTGEIIDGWQRIVVDFTMPELTEYFRVRLNAHPTFNTYFDDIRIHPYNGSMKSYVYDGETFWLTSELDDNNYATFYEYDEEGGLVRIKKETSQGIVTIQETRSNTIKQDDETE